MGNKFIMMLLAFSVLINGIFGYKMSQDTTSQENIIEAVRDKVESEQLERRSQLEKKIDDLTAVNQELTMKNNEEEMQDETSLNTIEEDSTAGLSDELRSLALHFVNGYLTYEDLYAESRREGLAEFATEDVIDRLVPSLSQGAEVTEQGVTDSTITISSRLLNANVFLSDYDDVLETVEAIVQVEYETTVDGEVHQSEGTLVIKIEKIDGQNKVTQFRYQASI